MASGYDIWGVIGSVLGLLTFVQLFAAYVNGQLPLKRLRAFDQMLEETEDLLQSVEEEGLFNDDATAFLSSAKQQLTTLCDQIKCLRQDAFIAKSLKDELKQWWGGLSSDIVLCCKELKCLRAQITTTSSERRAALAQRQAVGSAAVPTPTGESIQAAGPLSSAGESDGSLEGNIRPEPRQLEESKADLPASDPQIQSAIAPPPAGTHGDTRGPARRSDSANTLPPYRRQTNPPPYPAVPTFVLARCSVNSADAARATRRILKAYRRNLMVHNVPWRSQTAQHPHHGTSAASSARALERPSNATRHWKLLEEKSKNTLRPYVAVLSRDAEGFFVPPPNV